MKTVRFLRWVGLAEGISFLVLLFIAMPLKYYFGFPLAVKVVGWAHGALFVAFNMAVFAAMETMRWNLFTVIPVLAASVFPFGTFILDRSLKRRQQELLQAK